MTPQEVDRIECAIRHIQTSIDVDPWAVEIAVEAMQKQIPKQPKKEPEGSPLHYKYCPRCNEKFTMYDWRNTFCKWCGQAIDFGGD